MHAYLRYFIVLLLMGQGIYDLALGGWLWLIRSEVLAAQSATARVRLHAIYCHCKVCPDVAKCCCLPSHQIDDHDVVRRCDAADEGKIPNTWNCRVVTVNQPEIPLLFVEKIESAYRLPVSVLPVRVDHPPRASV